MPSFFHILNLSSCLLVDAVSSTTVAIGSIFSKAASMILAFSGAVTAGYAPKLHFLFCSQYLQSAFEKFLLKWPFMEFCGRHQIQVLRVVHTPSD